MDKVFASDYPRDSEDRVLFPRDTNLRALLFPLTDPSEHIAKAHMLMVRSLVEYVSEARGARLVTPELLDKMNREIIFCECKRLCWRCHLAL